MDGIRTKKRGLVRYLAFKEGHFPILQINTINKPKIKLVKTILKLLKGNPVLNVCCPEKNNGNGAKIGGIGRNSGKKKCFFLVIASKIKNFDTIKLLM